MDLQTGLGNGREAVTERVIGHLELVAIAFAFSLLRDNCIIEFRALMVADLDNLVNVVELAPEAGFALIEQALVTHFASGCIDKLAIATFENSQLAVFMRKQEWIALGRQLAPTELDLMRSEMDEEELWCLINGRQSFARR